MINKIAYTLVKYGGFAGVGVYDVEIGRGEESTEDVVGALTSALSSYQTASPRFRLRLDDAEDLNNEGALETLHSLAAHLRGKYILQLPFSARAFSEVVMQGAMWISVLGNCLHQVPQWSCNEYIAVNPGVSRWGLLEQDSHLTFPRTNTMPQLQFIPGEEYSVEEVMSFLALTPHPWQIAPKASKLLTQGLYEKGDTDGQ
jgi:hypothetical protein